MFAGTLRFNLDPVGKHSDDGIWEALELAHLKPFVQKLPGGLDELMAEEGGNLRSAPALLSLKDCFVRLEPLI